MKVKNNDNILSDKFITYMRNEKNVSYCKLCCKAELKVLENKKVNLKTK